MKILSLLNVKSTLSIASNPLCSPSTMAKKIYKRKIQLAALTDLNTAMNCPAFYAECSKHNVLCLFGMEAWTSDGLKTLVLFSDLKLAMDFSTAWYGTLPDIPAKNSQFYVDENGDIIGELKKELENRSSVSYEKLRAQVEKYNGIMCYVKAYTSFFLDTGNEGLFTEDSTINLKAIGKAFEKLQVPQAEPLT
ncbi:MAG: PHP domain-containing protein [Treponema sp.]|nr:PHP domain-containing protein [Treponema sp.]